jgi:SAM-dependent methyltransferase
MHLQARQRSIMAETTSRDPVASPTFREPFRSAFRELILGGTGRIDIYDSSTAEGYAVAGPASPAYIDREVGRVELHLRHIVRYLQRRVAPTQILDVGCGTGGLTVALALAFPAAHVLGVDPAAPSLDAARVRVQGYGVSRVDFRAISLNAGWRMPASTW